jgi:hypothetical protein
MCSTVSRAIDHLLEKSTAKVDCFGPVWADYFSQILVEKGDLHLLLLSV